MHPKWFLAFAALVVCALCPIHAGSSAGSEVVTRPNVVKHLVVPIGRSLVIEQRDLNPTRQADAANEICKVEVIGNEPISMRVGRLRPRVFSCSFPVGSVRYTHFGSPQLSEDVVKLRVLRFKANETKTELVDLLIRIDTSAPYESLVVRRQLKVKGFFQLSRPIDGRVLEFRQSTAECVVRFGPPSCRDGAEEEDGGSDVDRFEHHRRLPARGRLVAGKERSPVSLATEQPCAHFLHAGVRYRHLMPPTPDVDFVPLLIITRMAGSDGARREWVQLRVVIEGALPNAVPVVNPSAGLLLELERSAGAVALGATVLSARDEESSAHCPSANDLIFNLTGGISPAQGLFYHLLEANAPVTSFRQSDVAADRIVYRLPDVDPLDSKAIFQTSFELSILDGDFAVSSTPVVLKVFVRPNTSYLPRIAVISGLVLYEGQQRQLSPRNFRLFASSPQAKGSVRVSVVGGPRHGNLTLDGRIAGSFSWSDLERGAVHYAHDDSDSTADQLYLRVTDDPYSLQVMFPISIVPKDDSPPKLITNLIIKVDEGRQTVISNRLLLADDSDSPNESILYLIRKYPRAGHVLRRSLAHQFGVPVANFTQSEIDDGLVIYAHAKSDITRDDFEVILRDVSAPTPNESPLYRVSVEVRPLDDDPPRTSPGATSQTSVNETDFVFITRRMLHYVDQNAKDEQIAYTVTVKPRSSSEVSSSDVGKLVLLNSSDIGGLAHGDRYRLPEANAFQQQHVNHNRLVYLSPQTDIGPTLLDVYFVFSVSDVHGNHLHGQLFNITVLPVNNKPPEFRVGTLVVYEGNSSVLSTSVLSVSDRDTPLDDLEMWLHTLPNHGVLSVDGKPLNVGHNFGVGDILESRVLYSHQGSEAPSDQIAVVISDRAESVIAVINVTVIPVDDENPFLRVPDAPSGLSVNEGDYIMISQDVLSAVDPDTDNDAVRFSIVDTPKFGSILVDGNRSDQFTQEDLLSGRVQYVHSGREVGQLPQSDDINFVLTDGKPRSFRGRSGVEDSSVHTLKITILPVDNLAPALSQRGPIRVPEGSSHPVDEGVVLIVDDDSSAQKTILVVARQPRHGFLENRSPTVGSEVSNLGKKIDSFGLSDFLGKRVHYVQSEHRGIEPTSDSFVLYATDGIHRSAEVEFNVTISPQNDEPPQVVLQNFTILQSSSKLLDSEILSVTDLDRPANFITVTLKTPPRLGKMTLGKGAASHSSDSRHNSGSSKGAFTHLSWDDFDSTGVIYNHNGFSNEQDNFTLLITDGVHAVQLTCFVDVTASSQSRPRVALNAGLTGVSPGQSSLLTESVLRAEADGAGPEEMFYRVERLPKHGTLQVRRKPDRKPSGDASWKDVVDVDGRVFSQLDINTYGVRYFHKNVQPLSTRDGFNFVVSYGELSTTPETFPIQISARREDVSVVMSVKAIDMDAGENVVLGPGVINLSGKHVHPSSKFRILSVPLEGRVVLRKQEAVPISEFTMNDFLENQVMYVHEYEDADGSQDHFRIGLFEEATNATLATATVTIGVSPRAVVAATLPPSTGQQLVTWAEPVVSLLQPLVADAGDRVLLNPSHIHSSQPNATTYRILRFPQFGHLELDGVPMIGVASYEVDVTQRFIDEGRVSYFRRLGHGNLPDYFIFRVHNPNRTLHAAHMEYRLDIVSESVRKPIVRLELHSPDALEDVDDGRQGFVFTENHIRLSVSHLQGKSLRYSIRKPPQYGQLEDVGQKLRALQSFLPLDVHLQRIRFVLNADAARLGATRDSFEISVVDSDGINVALKSMELRWSIIYFGQKEYDVCEDIGLLSISVHRTSNLEQSAFVGIDAIGNTAYAGDDFTASRVRQLQFDPGTTTVTWKITIQDDGRNEHSVESVNVRLSNPVNAIIDADSEVIIRIHDKKRDSCIQSMNSPKTNERSQVARKKDPAPATKMQDCDASTSGSTAQITYGSSNILLICDGNSWVPQPKSPSSDNAESEGERAERRRKNNAQQRPRNRERKVKPSTATPTVP